MLDFNNIVSSRINSFCSRIYTLFVKLYYKNNIIIGNYSIIFYRCPIKLSSKATINIGTNCMIGRSKYGYHAGMPFYTSLFAEGNNSKITIGNNCRLNGVYIHSKNNIVIGNNTLIASGVSIIDSNGHILNSTDRTQGCDESIPIIIGDNVWIGLNSIILKGTKIGNNSVVAAGSVVKGVFPENCIIMGNPAKVVSELKL